MTVTRTARLALALGLLLTASASAAAAGDGDPVQVVLGKSHLMQVEGRPSVIMVGNPTVADVVVESDGLLFIVGLQPGETNLFVLDDRGRTLLETDVVVGQTIARQVTVHRGSAEANMSCNPRCSPIANPAAEGAAVPGDSTAASGGDGGTSDAPSGDTPDADMQQLLNNMVSSALEGGQTEN